MAKTKAPSQAPSPAQSRSQSASLTPGPSTSTTPTARKTIKPSTSTGGGSVSKPRLTAHQKNTNHKDAENKRRNAIREQFTELASLVPGAEGLERSEYVMLQKTIKHFREEVGERRRMVSVAQGRGLVVPKELILGDGEWGGGAYKRGNVEEFEEARRRRIEREGGVVGEGEDEM